MKEFNFPGHFIFRSGTNFKLILIFLLAFTFNNSLSAEGEPEISLEVHKTAYCGCCKKWISHAQKANINVIETNHENLDVIKDKFDISSKHKSCHTSVSKDGFVFEGHVHAAAIKKFLADPIPNSMGLTVPGMPVGSPGMEFDNRNDDYEILVMFENEKDEVYMHSTQLD